MFFDMMHIINTPGIDVQYFEGLTESTLNDWQTWRKPRGTKEVYIMTVGGGGGGGGAQSNSTVDINGGGGGGGGQTTVWLPGVFVQDNLYIQTGAGGYANQTPNSAINGLAGVVSYVCIEPSNVINPAYTIALANPGNGGTAVNAGGVGGTGGALAAIGSMPLAGRGLYNFFVGQSGTNGGSVSAGVALTLPVTGLCISGGSGGGSGFAGGTIGPASTGLAQILPVIQGGVIGPPVGNGYDGIKVYSTTSQIGGSSAGVMMFYGGTGGGSNSTTGGVNGGIGAPGCGGGGGACSQGGSGAGFGGYGGPGFVYIISFF